jgi:rod shape-determining protein MreC
MTTGQFAPGDILVTSGTGGIFPPNIPVAKVTERGRDAALAAPLSRPDALDFATVMKAYLPSPPPPAADTRP